MPPPKRELTRLIHGYLYEIQNGCTNSKWLIGIVWTKSLSQNRIKLDEKFNILWCDTFMIKWIMKLQLYSQARPQVGLASKLSDNETIFHIHCWKPNIFPGYWHLWPISNTLFGNLEVFTDNTVFVNLKSEAHLVT